MGKLRPFVRKDSYMPNKKWIPFVIGNGYTTTDGASGPAPEYETVTGNPVSFNAITPFPLKQLQIAFSPVQDLHGYDSPWPAGGHYNQWDEDWEEGMISWSGENASATNKIRSKGYIPVTPETTYYAKTPANIQIFYYDEDKTFVRYEQSSLGNKTFTIPADCYYMRFFTYVTDSYPPPYKNDIAINYPATVKTYSPYSNICPISGWDGVTVYHSGADTSDPQTISISFGSTVYSGTLDVLTGVVTVTHGIADMGSMAWVYNSGGQGRFTSDSLAAAIASYTASQVADVMCEAFSPKSANALYTGAVGVGVNNTTVWVHYTGTDPDAFKSEMSGVNLVYPLDTPITIQLTPQEVDSLAGDNTMWSNANQPITVEYRKN